nr:hypothetical protein [Prochloraceae cyanobacterium]
MGFEIKIIDISALDEAAIVEVANLLVEGFRENWPDAWPNLDSALEEVKASFGGVPLGIAVAARISRVAVDRTGRVLGWIGAVEQYEGNVWEIHPL